MDVGSFLLYAAVGIFLLIVGVIAYMMDCGGD